MNGVVAGLDAERATAALTQATLTTATVLNVDNAAIFDPDGGSLIIDTATATYTSASETANTVTLSAAVGTAYEVGVPVAVADAVVSYAVVQPADPDADEIRVILPPDRAPTVAIGDPVVAELQGGAWVLSRSVGVVRNGVYVICRGLPAGAAIAISNSTWTGISTPPDYINGVEPNHSGWSAGAPLNLQAPTDGAYLLTVLSGWAANATGERRVRALVNGTVMLQSNPRAGTSQIHTAAMVGVLPLSMGDLVDVQVWQNSGGNLDLQPDNELTNVSLVRL